MYARSTTIQGQPSSIDAGIAHTRDSVMPALEGIDGCVGLSLLVDRTSGRCIVTTSWESEDAMRASEESIRPIRDRAAELSGGSRQVEEWEIAAMHREHRASEGACVRATWVKVGPDQIDRGIDFYKMTYPARPRGAGRFLQWQPAGRPSIRSRRGLGDLRQRRSDGAEQGPVGQHQGHGQSGSTRRGARRVRLRVGGCTPECARDGLTGCRCRDRRERLGHLADLSRGMVFVRTSTYDEQLAALPGVQRLTSTLVMKNVAEGRPLRPQVLGSDLPP